MNAGSKYDMVLMDIIMPNLDGVSACHLIRQFDSTPIIAMTSNIRSDDISMYFQHGTNPVRFYLFEVCLKFSLSIICSNAKDNEEFCSDQDRDE